MTGGPPDTGPSRGVIVGFLFVIGLVVLAIYLVQALIGMVTLQNCVASGRTNCAPISTAN